jgi:hypothetical protein
MTAIWQNDGTGWRLSAPIGFPEGQTLHDLVEEAPQILRMQHMMSACGSWLRLRVIGRR